MTESNQKKYRRLLGELDQLGYVIHINRVCEKRYELQVNWEIKKLYRKRDSCNKFILKIHKKKTMAKEKKVAEILEIPIHLILTDSNNPRANYTEDTCVELAKSMKQSGLLQPIMVRPKAGIEPLKYMVIYGHRRLWAAKYLKWETITAQVRELSDDETFEIQIIENLQREDVNPMDESFAFQELIKKGLSTPEIIADKIGKSPKYVYDRVILQQVIPAMQAAVRIGQFTITHAKQFARVTPEDQLRLWVVINNKNSSEIDPAYIRRLINDTFKLKLGDAVFPTGDSQLVPAAGSCFKCTKHSGCRQLLFEEVKDDDVCFDLDCYKSKETAYVDRLIEKYKAEGKEVKLLSTHYYTKNDLLLPSSEWEDKVISEEESDSNTVGIVVEVPTWQQNKIKIGEVKRLADFKEEEQEEEEEEVIEVIQEEGEEFEDFVVRKKEVGKSVHKSDIYKLLNYSIMEEVIGSYQRGAFDIELLKPFVKNNIIRTQFSDDISFVKRVCELLRWEIKPKKSTENDEIKDSISWKETILAKIDDCGFDDDAIKNIYLLVDLISHLYRTWWSPDLIKWRNEEFPELSIAEKVTELESKFDIGLIA